jgi:hypothetical protein
VWAQELVDCFRRAEGVFESIFERWRSVVVGVGKDNAPDRTPCLLGGAAESLRGRDDKPVSPHEARAFNGCSCLRREQLLQRFANGSGNELPHGSFLQEKPTLLSGEWDVEAREEALDGLRLQGSDIGDVGHQSGFGQPDLKSVLRYQAERRVHVHGQVRCIAKAQNCLPVCWRELREEMFCQELRTSKDDSGSLDCNNVPVRTLTQGAHVACGAVFAVEGGRGAPDALSTELVREPVAEGRKPTGEGEAAAFSGELIAEKVAQAIGADQLCRRSHCGAGIGAQETEQEGRTVWSDKLGCSLCSKPCPGLFRQRVGWGRQHRNLLPKATEGIAFMSCKWKLAQDACVPEPRVDAAIEGKSIDREWEKLQLQLPEQLFEQRGDFSNVEGAARHNGALPLFCARGAADGGFVFQYKDLVPELMQQPCTGQACRTGANDENIAPNPTGGRKPVGRAPEELVSRLPTLVPEVESERVIVFLIHGEHAGL